jgi:hypothetical protein
MRSTTVLDIDTPRQSTLTGLDLPFVLPQPREAVYGEMLDLPGFSVDAPTERLASQARRLLGDAIDGGMPLSIRIDASGHGAEGYRLEVEAAGVRIEASTEQGAAHALTSLSLLVSGAAGRTQVRSARILDAPAFTWRGLIAVPEVLDWVPEGKFNLLQDSALRAELDDGVRRRTADVLRACDEMHVTYMAHLGYMGSFGDWKLTHDDEGMRRLRDYYGERHAMGVRAFTVDFDDKPFPAGEGGLWGERHGRACAAVHDAVGADSLLVFCGVPYAGDPAAKLFMTSLQDGRDYLDALRRTVPAEVDIFWTGVDVYSPEMDAGMARRYGEAAGRRAFVWDNDPLLWVNSLTALAGRPAALAEHCRGYVANVGDFRFGDRVTPMIVPILLSIADYTWNPEAYERDDPLARMLTFLAGSRRDEVLRAYDAARSVRNGAPMSARREDLQRWSASLGAMRNAAFDKELHEHLAGY